MIPGNLIYDYIYDDFGNVVDWSCVGELVYCKFTDEYYISYFQ